MKANSPKILSAVVTGLFVLGTSLYAQGGRDAVDSRTTHPVMTASAITKADAEKNYRPSEGNYRLGTLTRHNLSGLLRAPYPHFNNNNCWKLPNAGQSWKCVASKELC